MTDWQNFYSSYDFPHLEESEAIDTADIANKKLNQTLKRAKKVYRPCKTAPWYERKNVYDADTHSAKLIDIRKLKND